LVEELVSWIPIAQSRAPPRIAPTCDALGGRRLESEGPCLGSSDGTGHADQIKRKPDRVMGTDAEIAESREPDARLEPAQTGQGGHELRRRRMTTFRWLRHQALCVKLQTRIDGRRFPNPREFQFMRSRKVEDDNGNLSEFGTVGHCNSAIRPSRNFV
jgi:hypothetical protein